MNSTGRFVLRYSLVFFLVMFGAAKFTAEEANGIQPMMAHSPFLFWVDRLLGVRGGSDLIGCLEITIGTLIALRRFRPFLSACGSLWAAAMFLVTLSFLFTTPGLNPQGPDAGFLLKDLTLFGAAVWTAGEALAAASRRRPQMAAVLTDARSTGD